MSFVIILFVLFFYIIYRLLHHNSLDHCLLPVFLGFCFFIFVFFSPIHTQLCGDFHLNAMLWYGCVKVVLHCGKLRKMSTKCPVMEYHLESEIERGRVVFLREGTGRRGSMHFKCNFQYKLHESDVYFVDVYFALCFGWG